MQKVQSIIPYPKGLWLSNSTPAPQGYCSILTNFIPTQQGLELRKGILKLSENIAPEDATVEYKTYNFICTYKFANSLLLFANDGVYSFKDNGTGFAKISDFTLTPINFIETNNRVLLFFNSNAPYEVYFDGFSYEIKQLNISNDDGFDFVNFSSAVKYRETLYYYKENENKLYYTIPLAYTGVLKSYDLSAIFGSVGRLKFLAVLGYSAGGGVSSNLIAVFDSGDVLVMDGLAPDLSGEWVVVTKISLGTQVYNSFVELGTGLIAVTNEGLVDLQTALKTDDILQAKQLSEPLKDSYIDWSSLKLTKHNNFLVLNILNQRQQFLFNQDTGGYCLHEGYSILQSVSFNGKFYLLSNENILFKAFVNKNDDGQDIKATYLTSWDSLGTTNRKKNNFVTLDLFQEGGSSTVYCQVASDYKVNNLNKASLPKQLNFLKTWSDIRTDWQNYAITAWYGESLNQYFNIKFSRGALGRTLACKVEVIAAEVDTFKLGNLSLDMVVTNS